MPQGPGARLRHHQGLVVGIVHRRNFHAGGGTDGIPLVTAAIRRRRRAMRRNRQIFFTLRMAKKAHPLGGGLGEVAGTAGARIAETVAPGLVRKAEGRRIAPRGP